MKIYIEYVMLNNLLVNFMLLYLSVCINKFKISFWRILSSSTIGMVYALALPFISFNGDIVIKILLSLVMTFVASKVHNIREYLRLLVAFYMFTFLFGGTLIGLTYLTKSDFINSLIYPNSLSVSFVAIMVILLAIVIKSIMYVCEIRRNRDKYYRNVTISKGNNKVNAIGYLDTGNRLYLHNSLVVVLDDVIFDEIFDNQDDYIDININTVNNSSSDRAYRLDYIEVIRDGVHLVYNDIFAMKTKRKFEDFKVLLHAEM